MDSSDTPTPFEVIVLFVVVVVVVVDDEDIFEGNVSTMATMKHCSQRQVNTSLE
jgi:hypothetical protein